jgi:hypothetical protein
MNDFLLDTTGDMLTKDGDFVCGKSDQQQQGLLLMLPKGAIKEFPDTTVGLLNYLESEDSAGLLREVRVRFAQDGMQVKKVGFENNGNLEIDAPYR